MNPINKNLETQLTALAQIRNTLPHAARAAVIDAFDSCRGVSGLVIELLTEKQRVGVTVLASRYLRTPPPLNRALIEQTRVVATQKPAKIVEFSGIDVVVLDAVLEDRIYRQEDQECNNPAARIELDQEIVNLKSAQKALWGAKDTRGLA